MALQREAIYVALLAKLVGATTWATTPTRRLRDVSKVGNDAQPTAFLIDAEREQSEFSKGLALKWSFQPEVMVYARTDDQGTAPGTTLNALLTAIEAALEDSGPGGKSPTTLGGLVSHCRIASIESGAGHADGQAVALLTLDVLAVAQ